MDDIKENKSYYATGELLGEFSYVNNLRHGLEKWYFGRGNRNEVHTYRRNFLHGVSITFLYSNNINTD